MILSVYWLLLLLLTFQSFQAMTTTTSTPSSWPHMLAPPFDAIVQRDTTTGKLVSVPTMMNYVSQDTTLISTRRNTAGSDAALEGATWVPTLCRVYNGRNQACSLHKNGFELVQVQQDTSSKLSTIDYLDQVQVVEQYYPHCEALIKQALGGKGVTVKAFDHNVRASQSGGQAVKNSSAGAQVQNPAGMVHADYTRVSAPKRIQALTEPPKINDVRQNSGNPLLDAQDVEQAISGKRRFALVNVWKNIDPNQNSVQQMPLACIDASTVTFDDLRTFQIHYEDRVGENYFCCPSNRHKWMYFSEIQTNEALLLKQWDSHGDMAQGKDQDTEGSTSFTVHSAFVDPSSPKDAPPRQSIEVRCVAIWDQEE